MNRTLFRLVIGGLCVLALSGCAVKTADSRENTSGADQWVLPTGAVDYQLGGSYEPADDVQILVRDRTSEPDPDRYSICYVNGFQTQPEELDQWPEQALLHTQDKLVFDAGWPDEALLDTRTPESRSLILERVTPWITGCADSGFDAVEFDNLDTYTRSAGALTREGNLELAKQFVAVAHNNELAAGQKNAAEDAQNLKAKAGFDFAVAEECAAYEECSEYSEVYGSQLIDIEYTDQLPRTFDQMCAHRSTPESTVLRDRDLATPDDLSYIRQSCP